jgi:hypothetical protein
MLTRALLTATAVALLIFAPGCVISVNHTNEGCCPDQQGVVGNYAGAIRAAGTISISSDRCATLNTIAAKLDIDEPSQIMLINSLRGSWGISSDKAAVLETLVKNPALTSRAALHIANHLEQIVSLSSDRKTIADLLASRPMPASAVAPAAPAAK